VDASFAEQHLSLKPGSYVLLAVSDTGMGMSAEVCRQCFEPFFTTKEAGKGTGLGLSTVYGIVKQSEGAIFVYSEPGCGSAFKIFLPFIDGGTAPVEVIEAPQLLSGTETILLVEDEDGLRKYVRETLERKGYTVVATGSGSEALRFARAEGNTIDLLLTDMVMPEMGGAELAEAFVAARPHVPVLRMSGYSDRLRGEDGHSNFVQKPFTPVMLLSHVRRLLGNGRDN
jgi:CheY-like chemotaxis protein